MPCNTNWVNGACLDYGNNSPMATAGVASRPAVASPESKARARHARYPQAATLHHRSGHHAHRPAGHRIGLLRVFGLEPGWNSAGSALFLVGALALPARRRNSLSVSSGPAAASTSRSARFSARRLVRKLTALWAILAVLLLCYAILPLYRTELYQPFHWLLSNFL